MNVKDIKNLKKVWAFNGNFAAYETTENKAGIINRQGEIIYLADKYDFAFYIENGIFNLQTINSTVPAIFYDANLRKEVEKPNHEVTKKPELPSFAQTIEGSYWCAKNRIAIKEGNLYGIKDEKGETLAPAQYSYVSYAIPFNYKNDRIAVKNEKGEMGYIDLDGKELVPCAYKYIIWCKRIGVYKIETLEGKWGFMNSLLQIIIPPIYDSIDAEDSYGLSEIAVSKDGRCYFINEKQEEVNVF